LISFYKEQYSEAITIFEKLVIKGEADQEWMRKLIGECRKHINDSA